MSGRYDLEKAIYAHGGFSLVAKRMNWKLQYSRKPTGYWSFSNLRQEILQFIDEHDLERGEMPLR